MSEKSSLPITLSLEPGDVIYIEAFHEHPPSTLVVDSLFDDAICGYVTFAGDPVGEYGELYDVDFHHIYGIVKTAK